jgi:glutamate-1-semialdehyde aminotransferase/predicted aldo/keto reductase-like oxidoreductase
MQKRRLGRTNLQVSVVGFGTCQLRMVPETQAIDTLLWGFDLGVNLVHTAPDYEGAEDIVAEATARTSRKVIVASQGYDVHGNSDGPVRHFEHLFEATCRRFRTDRMELYGIACVDDREAYKENVWGKGGMVEFLQKKKAQGRIGGTFCTTHGNPEFIAKLVRSGAFDAIMVAYNELGFHLLSYNPPPGRHFENLQQNKAEIFPLCKELDVGVMVMKPLAGGLLCRSRAFPPRYENTGQRFSATDVLRSILANSEVTCVMPGTASVAEAKENAKAGHAPFEAAAPVNVEIRERISLMQTNICSRCGACEQQCSQKLPVSWLYRAGYVALHPSETFETWNEVEYFRLHPKEQATCSTCPDVTCQCPSGLDIPRSLSNLHTQMIELRDKGLVSAGGSVPAVGGKDFCARVVLRDLPQTLAPGERATARFFVENAGTRSWFTENNPHCSGVALAATIGNDPATQVRLRHDVHPGERCHFVFEVAAPHAPGKLPVKLQLLGEHEGYSEKTGPLLFEGNITITAPEAAAQAPRPPAPQSGVHEYAVEWIEHNLPEAWPEGSQFHAYVRFANRGTKTWLAQHRRGHCVDMAIIVNGGPPKGVRVTRDVPPGGEITLALPLPLTSGGGPTWEVKIGLVEQNVAWFSDKGAQSLFVKIKKAPPETGPTAEALVVASKSNNWGYQPTSGITRGRDGRRYPLFIREARGARVRDPEGNEWVDYVMGWGSALLGYAHPEIQAAVTPHLNSGAVLSLPHELEMKLTAALCDRFPGNEAVLFGKNGSDVCTAAVRVARIFTGRRQVLFSGYHGWQDWHASVASPELADPRATAEAFRFPTNDLDGFHQLLKKHRGQVAAVVLEPAAQVEGVEGPVRDANIEFLTEVATTCRRNGIVLIFDEIMTGFRHKGGSVQHATGVVPDLTCLGKALTSGWPLSALLARKELLEQTVGRIYYHPTFKGEAYSFAAALAALDIYARQDVPAQVYAFGKRLKDSITSLSWELAISGKMVGMPYRMVYKFLEPDNERRCLKRTLLVQELMKRGVLTFRGFMLPSLAHGEEELAFTVAAFDGALRVVREADASGSYARWLEIPPIL